MHQVKTRSIMGNKRTVRTYEELLLEAKKYQTRWAFQKGSFLFYQSAYRRGLLDQICAHMPIRVSIAGENSPSFKWTRELVKVEALKYQTRAKFEAGTPGAYRAAIKFGILDEVCAHMGEYNYSKGAGHYKYTWTDEMLQERANKYSKRTIFARKDVKAYNTARRRGILDQICGHMENGNNSSAAELEIFYLVQDMYPDTVKLMDRKVKIDDKPYIKGFDIDIYIPSLKLGIEFDGLYWHSFKALKAKRIKKGWSEEDCKNYHKIKDSWFLSKGIKILHINENNWIKNKDLCIKQVLDFIAK